MGFFSNIKGWVHKTVDTVKRNVHKTVDFVKRGLHKVDETYAKIRDNPYVQDYAQKAFENNEILRDARAGYRLAQKLTGLAGDAVGDPNMSFASLGDKFAEARGHVQKWKTS